MTDEELIERAVSDIRAACQQYCVADCDCSDFARELRSRWQSLTATESKLETLTHELEQTVEKLSDMLAENLHIVDYVKVKRERDEAESRLDAAENAMREVVSHLQRSQRGSTHWAGCPDVHPVCQAIDMLVDALPLRDVESQGRIVVHDIGCQLVVDDGTGHCGGCGVPLSE